MHTSVAAGNGRAGRVQVWYRRQVHLDGSIGTTVVPALVAGTHWHQRVAISCHDCIPAAADVPPLSGKIIRRHGHWVPGTSPGTTAPVWREGVWRERASPARDRSEEHTSELQSLMRNSYDVF